MLTFQNENFIIDGKPVFLMGGELHYFRVPRQEWRDRIIKLKDAGCNLVSTYIPWIWHEKDEGKFDFTGDSTPERDLKYFLELIKEEGMYSLVRPGPYVMAEIRNEGLPHWIYANYPEVVAITADGQIHPTRVVSYLHPTYLELVDKWYQKVFQIITPNLITNGGTILMVQLDNEVGMLQWVTNRGDYSQNVIDHFNEYIKDDYIFCEKLETFRNGKKLEDFIMDNIRKPEKEYSLLLQQKFLTFMRCYYKQYITILYNMAVDYGLNVPIIVNVHGFDSNDYATRGSKYPIGLSQLYEAAQIDNTVLAGDYYIGNIVPENFTDLVLANALTKAVQNQNQPLFSAEFQGGTLGGVKKIQPSTYELNTVLCVANGMNAFNYYMFVGGENWEDIGLFGRRHDWQAPISTDGNLKRQYYVIKDLLKTIKVYENQLLETKKVIDVHIAFDPDYYMTEYSNEHTNEQRRILEHYRETFFYRGLARGITLNNYSYEAVDIKRVDSIDVKRIPALVVFSTPYMNEEVQLKLVEYIKDGGKLILYPVIPTKNLVDEPCTILQDAIGVQIKAIVEWGNVNIGAMDSVNIHQTELYETTEGFAYRDEYPKSPMAFEKEIGNGKVVVFGIGMVHDYDYKDAIVEDLLHRVGIIKPFSNDDSINIFLRKGDNGSFLFLLNYDDYDKETSIQYKSEVLFGGSQITIPHRSSLILPMDWMITEHIKVKYSTAEFMDKVLSPEEVTFVIGCKQKTEVVVIEIETDDWIPEIIEQVAIIEMSKNTYKLIINNEYKDKTITFRKLKGEN